MNTPTNMLRAVTLSLAVTLLSTLPGQLAAQYSGFGIKAGPQANFYRAHHIRTVPSPGLTMGVYLPISAAPRLEVQPELLLSVMGSGLIEPDGDRMTMRTMYLLAPVSAKFFLSNEINLQGGVQLGKILTAHRVDGNGTTEVRNQFRSMDMGFNLGVGLDTRSGVDVTLRYYSGMPALLIGDDALFPRNRSVQFTVGKRLVQVRRSFNRRRN